MNKIAITKFIEANSYFENDENDDDFIFSTRKNGDVGSETASKIDMLEASKLKRLLLNEFENITVTIEIVDEWVMIFIAEFKEVVDTYKFVFIKDKNGQGFSQTFDTIDELIKTFKTWINVDWDLVKSESEVNEPYKKTLKLSTDKDNTWGYDFFIEKYLVD